MNSLHVNRSLAAVALGAALVSSCRLAMAQVGVPAGSLRARLFAAPASAPRDAWIGVDAGRVVGEACFGWFDPQDVFKLSLDAPLSENAWVDGAGANTLTQRFTISTSSFEPMPVPSGAPAGAEWARWFGEIAGDFGSCVVEGLYIGTGDEWQIVPLATFRDQARMREIHDVFRRLNGLETGLLPTCVLDPVGELQRQQMNINARACQDAAATDFYLLTGGCIGASVWLCVATAGAGCIWTLGCIILDQALWISWESRFATEYRRSWACVCAESQFRQRNPGQPTPSSCGSFGCPATGIPIPKLR